MHLFVKYINPKMIFLSYALTSSCGKKKQHEIYSRWINLMYPADSEIDLLSIILIIC